MEQRERALKFLVHLVGDLHQSVHAIKAERGGNGIDVTVTTQEGVNGPLPFNTNLHSAWDATLTTRPPLHDIAAILTASASHSVVSNVRQCRIRNTQSPINPIAETVFSFGTVRAWCANTYEARKVVP